MFRDREWHGLALRIRFPSTEEAEFCKQVNELLAESGAKVSAYEVMHPDDRTTYHLTFEHGSKRRSIHSDVPFHYDPPQAVMQRVHDWIAGVRLTNRWTTEVPVDLDVPDHLDRPRDRGPVPRGFWPREDE